MEMLYEQHNHWLVGWLRKKVGCPENAADISQDTFVRILKCRDTLLNLHNPRAYLAQTARNLVIDRARRETIEKNYLAAISVQASSEDGEASPEQIWQAVEALDQICQVLERLPKKVQQAFLLYYLDNVPQYEIANQLGICRRTVRSYLVQVLVRCQRIIQD